jgi:hypothetical protein
MGAPESPGKPFDIPKRDVWDAWLKVKENQGAPGVDGCSIADLETDLKNNLYKVWNRMSSGSYFPPPVRAVETEKAHGDGVRTLGIPPWPIGSLKRWWPDTWRPGWRASSTRTPTATAPGGRRTTRSKRPGGGAGSTTG